MRIVVQDMISISLEQKRQYREIVRVETGGKTGLLPYSRASQHVGSGIAAKRTVILSLNIWLGYKYVASLNSHSTSRID